MGAVGSPFDLDVTLADGTFVGLMIRRPATGRARIDGVLSPADRMQTLNVPWTYQHDPKGLGYSVRDSKADLESERAGRIAGYNWGHNIDATQDGVTLPSGAFTELQRLDPALGQPTCLVEWQGDVVLVMQHGIFSVDGGYAASLTYRDGLTAATSLYGNAVAYGDSLYVAQIGTGTGILRLAADYTPTPDADVLAHFLATAYWVVEGVGDLRLVRVDTPSTLSYLQAGGDPHTIADWVVPVPPIQVGSAAYAIRSLVVLDDVVWPIKAEGIFAVDENQEARNKTPQWVSQWDQLSGAATCAYQHGGIRGIAAAHADGIVFTRVTQAGQETVMLWVDPSQTGANTSPIRGRCYALMQYGKYLVAAIYNHANDTTYIVMGYPNPAGDPPFIWRGAHRVIPGQQITAMLAHTPGVGSDFQPRLWYAGLDTATQEVVVSWQYLPRASSALAEVGTGSAYRFETTWAKTFTGNDWGEPFSKKIPTHALLLGDGLGSGVSLTLASSVDTLGAFFAVDAATVPPGAEFNMTVDAGYVHNFRVVGSGTATQPAIFKSLSVEANIAKRQSSVLEVTVELGPASRTGRDTRDKDATWAAFLEAVEAGEQMTLVDVVGSELVVQIDPNIAYGLEEQTERGGTTAPRGWTRTATFRYVVREVVARWDVGVWDSSVYASGTG